MSRAHQENVRGAGLPDVASKRMDTLRLVRLRSALGAKAAAGPRRGASPERCVGRHKTGLLEAAETLQERSARLHRVLCAGGASRCAGSSRLSGRARLATVHVYSICCPPEHLRVVAVPKSGQTVRSCQHESPRSIPARSDTTQLNANCAALGSSGPTTGIVRRDGSLRGRIPEE